MTNAWRGQNDAVPLLVCVTLGHSYSELCVTCEEPIQRMKWYDVHSLLFDGVWENIFSVMGN